MRITRTMMIGPAIVALAASHVPAQGSPAPPDAPGRESFAVIHKAWMDTYQAYSAEYKAAHENAKKKGEAALKAFQFDKPLPTAEFSPRFLAIAEKDPAGPDAVEALKWAIRTSFVPKGDPLETRTKALKILEDYYATRPEIKSALGILFMFDDKGCRRLVDNVIAHNRDRKVQLAAIKGRITSSEGYLVWLKQLEKAPKGRGPLDDGMGKAWVDDMLQKADRAKSELAELKKTLREKYGDLITEVAIGKPAPEVVSQNVKGTTVRLSELKGNVVILDIWATWCGPCKAMIPHERAMVERLKGKPFVLVSISADEKKETLTNFLAAEKMPWTHWWSGMAGIIEDWDVQSFPTIYVIDARGVIRHKDLRGKELEKAVDALVEEATARPAKGA